MTIDELPAEPYAEFLDDDFLYLAATDHAEALRRWRAASPIEGPEAREIAHGIDELLRTLAPRSLQALLHEAPAPDGWGEPLDLVLALVSSLRAFGAEPADRGHLLAFHALVGTDPADVPPAGAAPDEPTATGDPYGALLALDGPAVRARWLETVGSDPEALARPLAELTRRIVTAPDWPI